MALSCAAECALSLACARWALRRLSLSGADDSASWPAASPSSFAPGPAIRRMVAEAGPAGCRLVFVGHSLGAGVAALAAVVADDFLPRTPAPLQHIFGSIFCLPCLLCFICMRDTFVSEEKLKDASKLYAPGRVFHIVERENCRCGRLPPQVRTAVPAEGRFEHVVLSCNATSDHGIIWIEKEAQKALDLMEQEELTLPPSQQKMLRVKETESLADHQKLSAGNPQEDDTLSSSSPFSSPRTSTTSSLRSESSSTRSEWDELVEIFLSDHEEDGDGRTNMCNRAGCLPCCK
uniref:Mono-/di-acylglycerol lipase N-terminal domain-containing protein n=1 Tax=Oryza glumipatula TaxID=40148 RepID=A0A0D9ZCD7_9ORYZ